MRGPCKVLDELMKWLFIYQQHTVVHHEDKVTPCFPRMILESHRLNNPDLLMVFVHAFSAETPNFWKIRFQNLSSLECKNTPSLIMSKD